MFIDGGITQLKRCYYKYLSCHIKVEIVLSSSTNLIQEHGFLCLYQTKKINKQNIGLILINKHDYLLRKYEFLN